MGKVFKFNEFVNENYSMNESSKDEILLAFTNAKDDKLSDSEAISQVVELLGVTQDEVEAALEGELKESISTGSKYKIGDVISKSKIINSDVEDGGGKWEITSVKDGEYTMKSLVDGSIKTEDINLVDTDKEILLNESIEGINTEATVEEVGKYNVIETGLREIMSDLKKVEGLVILGAGGEVKDWIEGVVDALHKDKIIGTEKPNEVFTTFYKTETTGGRTDLIMVFNPSYKIDIGKLAVWRIRFGDCSWISDFIVNYASHYGIDSRIEDAKNKESENNEF